MGGMKVYLFFLAALVCIITGSNGYNNIQEVKKSESVGSLHENVQLPLIRIEREAQKNGEKKGKKNGKLQRKNKKGKGRKERRMKKKNRNGKGKKERRMKRKNKNGKG